MKHKCYQSSERKCIYYILIFGTSRNISSTIKHNCTSVSIDTDGTCATSKNIIFNSVYSDSNSQSMNYNKLDV